MVQKVDIKDLFVAPFLLYHGLTVHIRSRGPLSIVLAQVVGGGVLAAPFLLVRRVSLGTRLFQVLLDVLLDFIDRILESCFLNLFADFDFSVSELQIRFYLRVIDPGAIRVERR